MALRQGVLDFQNRVKVVIFRRFIAAALAASDAFVGDDIVVAPGFNRHRLHQATAFGRPVARIYIDILAEQAVRAMVGIAVAADDCAAVFTGKIFDFALELLAV